MFQTHNCIVLIIIIYLVVHLLKTDTTKVRRMKLLVCNNCHTLLNSLITSKIKCRIEVVVQRHQLNKVFRNVICKVFCEQIFHIEVSRQ
jgi:hypothetical protein